MVEVNLSKIFCDCFKEDDAAAAGMVKVLSRLPEGERERAIIELAKLSGIHSAFWKNRIRGLVSAKKK